MTKTEVRPVSQEAENALIEAKEFAIETGYKPLTTASFKEAIHEGTPLLKAMNAYVTNYNGSSSAVHKLRTALAEKGTLTLQQGAKAFSVLAKELESGRMSTYEGAKTNAVPLVPAADSEGVGSESAAIDGDPVSAASDEKPVLTNSKTYFDVGQIPDGRYAFFDPEERQDWIFLEVKTIKRNTPRTKIYEYGKFVRGRETLAPGTIEVRELRGDTRRLAGYQKPGGGYQGEFIPILISIADAPSPWSGLYARMIGHCGICGKRLTDEESRDRTIGPDCHEKWGDQYFENWDRNKMLAEAEEKRKAKLAAQDEESEDEEVA